MKLQQAEPATQLGVNRAHVRRRSPFLSEEAASVRLSMAATVRHGSRVAES